MSIDWNSIEIPVRVTTAPPTSGITDYEDFDYQEFLTAIDDSVYTRKTIAQFFNDSDDAEEQEEPSGSAPVNPTALPPQTASSTQLLEQVKMRMEQMPPSYNPLSMYQQQNYLPSATNLIKSMNINTQPTPIPNMHPVPSPLINQVVGQMMHNNVQYDAPISPGRGRGGRGRGRGNQVIPNQNAAYTGKVDLSSPQWLGRICEHARDQNGCRALQGILESGEEREITQIFNEVLFSAAALMKDQFGNYLMQKLIEVCTEEQRFQLLLHIGRQLSEICFDPHGTRSVQKIIECINDPGCIKLLEEALKHKVVELIKDLNGNHAVQKCLQKFSSQHKQFIYDNIKGHVRELANHRNGCCVLQRCFDHADSKQRELLNHEVIECTIDIIDNQFGNYVVQYSLDLDAQVGGHGCICKRLIRKLQSQSRKRIPDLCCNKFASNVLEKCIKQGDDDDVRSVVMEFADRKKLLQLLKDEYANYVVQTSLMYSETAEYELLRNLIAEIKLSPEGLNAMTTPHFKKIESKLNRTERLKPGKHNVGANATRVNQVRTVQSHGHNHYGRGRK